MLTTNTFPGKYFPSDQTQLADLKFIQQMWNWATLTKHLALQTSVKVALKTGTQCNEAGWSYSSYGGGIKSFFTWGSSCRVQVCQAATALGFSGGCRFMFNNVCQTCLASLELLLSCYLCIHARPVKQPEVLPAPTCNGPFGSLQK